jgi:plasmid maintenance system antidote protein VapI
MKHHNGKRNVNKQDRKKVAKRQHPKGLREAWNRKFQTPDAFRGAAEAIEANNEFQPDWASPPGDTIKDILKERKIPMAKFAWDAGKSPRWARSLIAGDLAITVAVAENLEKVFCVDARFWLNREAQYRSTIARIYKKEGT